MTERIEVTVDAEGNVKVAAQGVKGAGCKQLTEAIEKAIGRTTDGQKTGDFYQGAACQVPQQAKATQ